MATTIDSLRKLGVVVKADGDGLPFSIVANGKVEKVQVSETKITGKFKDGKTFATVPIPNDTSLPQLLQENGVQYEGKTPEEPSLLAAILTAALLVAPSAAAESPTSMPTSSPRTTGIRRSAMHIEIDEISKDFGTTAALHPVSLAIPSGALVALLGPSGSGKTTLLRILGGLEFPTSGRVLFDGQDATGLTVQERRAGFVFQSYALFRHMTVFENVAFGLRVRPRATRPSESEIRRKVHDLLGLVQLDWLADRYPSQLSGGQRQRIALARALAVEPKVLLLDEPFGALDAKVRKELRRWLRRLHDELHVTSIFVTHDQEEALEVADRVVLMNKGHIEQIGSPQDVWDHPASPFVYGFLGDVNLFHGRAHEGEMLIGADHHAVRLETPEHGDAQDAKAFAYVRPHDLHVERHTPGAKGMVARLTRSIVVGPVARLELEPSEDLGFGKDAVIEAQISAAQFREQALREGEMLVLTPRKARVFVES